MLQEKPQAGEDGHPILVVHPSKALQIDGTRDPMVGSFCGLTTLTTAEDDPRASGAWKGNRNASEAFEAVLKGSLGVFRVEMGSLALVHGNDASDWNGSASNRSSAFSNFLQDFHISTYSWVGGIGVQWTCSGLINTDFLKVRSHLEEEMFLPAARQPFHQTF